MYQPNFCAECGMQVIRESRRAWASRRFCPACAKRLRRARFAWPGIACAVLLTLGFAAGRAHHPTAPPLLVVERGRSAAIPTVSSADGSLAEKKPATQGLPLSSLSAGTGAGVEPPTDPGEVVSVCGARTKKGTPCSRRVRGTGRCWQHRGRAAMLPPAKLVVPVG